VIVTRAALALFVTGCVITGAAAQRRPAFEVASVKPQTRAMTAADLVTGAPRVQPGGLFNPTHATVVSLIVFAYELKHWQIVDGPDWIQRDAFEINARAGGDVPTEQIRLMVQSLLEDRFRLVTHTGQRDMEHLVLVPARADGRLGPYLQRVGDCTRETRARAEEQMPPRAQTSTGGRTSGCGRLDVFAQLISMQANMPVIDRTTLDGNWVYQMRHGSPLPGAMRPGMSAAPPGPPDPALPPFAVALEEQLGLKLESARGPSDVLVIESLQQPTEN
jgi:uncharacterized protein (TIGR03435 family)